MIQNLTTLENLHRSSPLSTRDGLQKGPAEAGKRPVQLPTLPAESPKKHWRNVLLGPREPWNRILLRSDRGTLMVRAHVRASYGHPALSSAHSYPTSLGLPTPSSNGCTATRWTIQVTHLTAVGLFQPWGNQPLVRMYPHTSLLMWEEESGCHQILLNGR